MSAIRSYSGSLGGDRDTYRGLMVTGVRMATCNQILDPWVYILLRRAILRKIYQITKRQASFKGSTFRSVRWDAGSFQNSEKNSVNGIWRDLEKKKGDQLAVTFLMLHHLPAGSPLSPVVYRLDQNSVLKGQGKEFSLVYVYEVYVLGESG